MVGTYCWNTHSTCKIEPCFVYIAQSLSSVELPGRSCQSRQLKRDPHVPSFGEILQYIPTCVIILNFPDRLFIQSVVALLTQSSHLSLSLLLLSSTLSASAFFVYRSLPLFPRVQPFYPASKAIFHTNLLPQLLHPPLVKE